MRVIKYHRNNFWLRFLHFFILTFWQKIPFTKTDWDNENIAFHLLAEYCICQQNNHIFYMCNTMASVIFCFIDNQIVYQKSNIYFWLKTTFDSQKDTRVPATSNLCKSCSFCATLTKSSSHDKVIYWKKSHHINNQNPLWSSIHNGGYIDSNII